MQKSILSGDAAVLSSQYEVEEKYWLDCLAGELLKTSIPYDFRRTTSSELAQMIFALPEEASLGLIKLSGQSDPRLHMILVAGIVALLERYTGNKDIVIGTPIYKQNNPADGQEFVNTVLPLRHRLGEKLSFKELILQVRKIITDASEHQNYPLEMLLQLLELTDCTEGFPLFDLAILLTNIHERDYLDRIELNLIFCFERVGERIQCVVEYNSAVYEAESIQRVAAHVQQLFTGILQNVDIALAQLEILPQSEKDRLLVDFNSDLQDYPIDQTIYHLFEEQVIKTPGAVAVRFEGQTLDYQELNERANRLARYLQRKGVGREDIVGLMMDRSLEMVVSLLAILKAGGAYLPIDPKLPEERILYMLQDAGAKVLLTHDQVKKDLSYTALQNFEVNQGVQVVLTEPRGHIQEFDTLPMPDRSLIDLRNYKDKIGMASVTNCISIQSTRGCPYHCLYCHKIWSKHHVHRSAENIYNEIEYYNTYGVTNFAFIDDCFNLDQENGRRLFQMIIQNNLDVQLFFPNGLRGDLLTPEYIDLMVAAGTRGINLSLETASPRLQRLLKKNLDLEKFKKVIDYIAEQHPNLILEIATMHGFPTETEEEALLTLNFIKDVKWLHFPYIHILKIFPNTEMEEFALQHGVKKQDILISKDRAFHELPETLPFPKGFTRKYQASFMNEYFLLKERLEQVLPVQMQIMDEEALIQKYNAYLPVEIKSIQDIIDFAGLDLASSMEMGESSKPVTIFERGSVGRKTTGKKVLLLDLSQHFSSHQMLYKVAEQPLGLLYLLTYLKDRFGEEIDGRVYKSGNDFDSYAELQDILEEYQPDMIGIRTLTFFKEFFHETVAMIRQWGIKVPIFTGGPYASSDYDTILKDKNVDLVVLGEGEYTLEELVRQMLTDGFQLPSEDILSQIKGIAYRKDAAYKDYSREVLFVNRLTRQIEKEDCVNLEGITSGEDLMYVMYTSGSTGQPKGVMVEHRQVNNCICWMQDKFKLQSSDIIVQRTNLTFDPSVWEIFWPLIIGASVQVLTAYQSIDAEFLLNLMQEETLTMMYCPATMVTAMTDLLLKKPETLQLTMPWLIIGAEPISMEVVKKFYRYYRGQIVNTYGPTECTINNTYFDLDPADQRNFVPIGKPVANNQIYILAQNQRLMPIKMAGEMYIAGKSVTRGYINNREKTDAAFLANPFGAGKLYRTGDIGRWHADGTIEIMGRVDEQVKIRGYRIELGEIEAALKGYGQIKDSIVLVRDDQDLQAEVLVCKKCGITSTYPGIQISEDGICDICQEFEKYARTFGEYFQTLDDLQQVIQQTGRGSGSEYDCLLLYNGGRGAAYALYHLVELGFKVKTISYDNGYITGTDLENIQKVTAKLGVEHEILRYPNSPQILKESLQSAHTVCRGCFHLSSALAGEYAYNHKIPVVVGATLSRGQIIENKLLMFLRQGITEIARLEHEIAELQKSAPEIDKTIFEHIDISVIKDGSVYEKVKFVDFYRYCDVTNSELIDYLDQKDPYWQSRKDYAIYSTNCPLKQIGDYGHLKAQGYHFYGSATSWEQRLGHITTEQVKVDLQCNVSEKGYENFIKSIGFVDKHLLKSREKYLCAYLLTEEDIVTTELREYLAQKLPEYMIPAYFLQIQEIPLTSNGKVDKRALPRPDKLRSGSKANYVAPETDLEKSLSEIWQKVLGVSQVGIEDSFFDLGGNSLKIIQVGSEIKENLGKELTTVNLFTYPTIHSLAEFISHQEESEANIARVDRTEQISRGRDRLQNQMRRRKGGA